MQKNQLFSFSYKLQLIFYGAAAVMMPVFTYFFLTNFGLKFNNLAALMISCAVAFTLIGIGSWLLIRPLQRILSISQTAIHGFQSGAIHQSSSFKLLELENAVHTIGKMAVLGHETIKGFRALPVPALLFDRNGVIISLSSGLRDVLSAELDGIAAPNGSNTFTGEHISSLFGELRVDHMFRNQHVPVILKENSDYKITATLAQLNENISRKEAGLILLNVEYKNSKYRKNNIDEDIIAELKTAYFTITNSFSEIAEFMHNLSQGNFSARMTLEAQGDLGRLVKQANYFAEHLNQLSKLLSPRIESSQNKIVNVHAENDDLLKSTMQMQRNLNVAYNHFSASNLTDQSIAEQFNGLYHATHLMVSETQTTHLAIIDAVNAHSSTLKMLDSMADFPTIMDDMGFNLKLLGLNAAVEASRMEQYGGPSASLHELCKDIRELGVRFRHSASEFRQWVMPIHDKASMAHHTLVSAQNAILKIAPAAIQVQNQVQNQEDIVRAALKPRIEAAQALEQALANATCVHHTVLSVSDRVGEIAEDLTELFELTSAVIPAQKNDIEHIQNVSNDADEHEPLTTAFEQDLSLDWFRRDILLRELSGELASSQNTQRKLIDKHPKVA